MSTPIQGRGISLFGKPLGPVPPNPANLDVIQFNFTTLQWELAAGAGVTGVQSSSNVGSGLGLALVRVLNDLPFKSLVAGDNVTLTGSPTEIEIKSDNTFVMGYHSDKNWQVAPGRFAAMFTSKADEAVEAEAQGFFNFGFTVREITVFVSNNIDITSSSITLKRNSVAIPATTITIPALTTGKFSISVTEAFGVADEIHDVHVAPTKGGVKNTSYYLECTRP